VTGKVEPTDLGRRFDAIHSLYIHQWNASTLLPELVLIANGEDLMPTSFFEGSPFDLYRMHSWHSPSCSPINPIFFLNPPM